MTKALNALATAPLRALVTGGTRWTNRELIDAVLNELESRCLAEGATLRLITGMASGADEIARRWAAANGVETFAQLLEVGEYPGPMHRYNEMMLARLPDLVLAFKKNFDDDWLDRDQLAGTEHMCRIAAEAGVPVLVNGTTWLTSTPGADGAAPLLSGHDPS